MFNIRSNLERTMSSDPEPSRNIVRDSNNPGKNPPIIKVCVSTMYKWHTNNESSAAWIINGTSVSSVSLTTREKLSPTSTSYTIYIYSSYWSHRTVKYFICHPHTWRKFSTFENKTIFIYINYLNTIPTFFKLGIMLISEKDIY